MRRDAAKDGGAYRCILAFSDTSSNFIFGGDLGDARPEDFSAERELAQFFQRREREASEAQHPFQGALPASAVGTGVGEPSHVALEHD